MRTFLLSLGLLLALGVSALATEYLVPRDFPNPAACILAAAPGDTCILQPGTHPGFVINKPNLTVSSSNGALATTVAGTVTIAADGVTLGRAGQGLMITGGVVIAAPSTSGITIEDNLITGNPGPGILVNATVGSVRDLSFLANEIRNNGGGGIIFLNAGSVDELIITGGAIEINGGGPGLGFAIGGSVRRLQVSGTRITTNAGGGVVFVPPTGEVEDSEFSGSMIQGNGAFGLLFANTGRVLGLMVSGNNISSHTTDNIRFVNGLVADTRFESDTIENAGAHGVNFSNAGAVEEVSFTNETIQRNGGAGLLFSNSDDLDTVEIVDSRVRNNGWHNIFVNHAPAANDFPVERFTIEGGFIDQAQDNGVRIVTATASIDFVRLVDVQVGKNGGMGVCLRTNSGSIGDLEFERVTVKENQGGAGTPCDLAPAPIGSGAEVITLTGNIGPVKVEESAFTNNGGFGLRLDSLGPGPAAGDLGPVEIRACEFRQNGTRAPAGLGSGLILRGRNVHDITINPTTASGNNDHGLDIQATNDISGITITGGEFSDNDRNVDTVGAGLNLSATQRLTGLRLTGARLSNNSQGARVQAGRASDNHINQCEISGNHRAGIEAAIVSGDDLDGTNNWWGSPSGPGGLGPGGGDAVTGNVAFDPWLAVPPPAVVTGANFQITSLAVSPAAPDVGATVTITATITNTGTDGGTQEIIVRIKSGTTVLQEERRPTPLPPAGSTTLTVSYAFTAAGSYTVEVVTDNDTESRTVTVGGGGPPPPGGLTIEQAIASLVPGEPAGAANPDLVIGDQEILQAISFWINGEEVPNTGGQTINDAKMLELISLWIGGTPVSGPGPTAGLASARTTGNQTALKVERIGFTGSKFFVQGQGIESLAVRVWDLAGRPVWSATALGNSLPLVLAGPDGVGLANGVYLYTVIVRGLDGSIRKSEVRKMAVLR